jgi:D-alanine-D-alanine ligase
MMLSTRSARSRTAAILHGALAAGANPDEQDVLVQLTAVEDGLGRLGYRPVAVPIDLDLETARLRLDEIRPAFVFNLVESVRGQGRLIHLATALLDCLGVPYTGCRTEAMFLTSHKPMAKALMRSHAIATPEWLTLPPNSPSRPSFPGPYIVKSVWEDASIGLDSGAVVADPRKLGETLRNKRRQFGGDWFVERFIDGREFNIGILGGPNGPEVLTPAEMCFLDYPEGKPRIVDYAAKWHEDSFEYRHTQRSFDFAPSDAPLIARLKEICERCWDVFGLTGYARVDFRVDRSGEPYVLEINANPCLSDNGGFIAAAARAGLNLTQVIERIITCAGAKRLERPARGVAASAGAVTAPPAE